MLPTETTTDGIVIVTLTPNPSKPRGGVVVLDSWLIAQMTETLDTVAASGPRGLILRSSSERVFIAGADLAEIDALDDAALDVYLRAGTEAFAKLHSMRCPSIAIIHKAALGGGLEVAMHCDGMLGVLPSASEKPWRIGLPECGLGICPGWGGTQMLPARIDPATAIIATANGTTMPISDVPHGLLDGTVNALADALPAACAWLAAHSRTQPLSHPRAITPPDAERIHASLAQARVSVPASDAATAVFDCIEAGCASGWTAALALERARLIALRHTPFARGKLEQFLRG
jgi:3-hydroxyacyl-CoA dehydrogenase/enoyl-CoA hydratase/3-hydroxybutyryl-CoA epimerase